MVNDIAFASHYTGILDAVYQRSSVSRCLNSGGRIVQARRHAKEIKIPKISVTGFGDYVRNQGYKTRSITYEYETKVPDYDRGIRLMVDVMDVEERAASWTASWKRARSSSARRWPQGRTPTCSLRSIDMSLLTAANAGLLSTVAVCCVRMGMIQPSAVELTKCAARLSVNVSV